VEELMGAGVEEDVAVVIKDQAADVEGIDLTVDDDLLGQTDDGVRADEVAAVRLGVGKRQARVSSAEGGRADDEEREDPLAVCRVEGLGYAAVIERDRHLGAAFLAQALIDEGVGLVETIAQ